MTLRTIFSFASLILLLVVTAGATGCASRSPSSEAPRPRVIPEIADGKSDRPPPLDFEGEVALADRLRDGGRLPEAAWHYVRGLQLDKQSPIPRQRLGYMQLVRDVHRAERIFQELVESHPDLASARVGLGLARLASGKHEASRESLLKAIEIAPDTTIAHVGLGMIDDHLGRHDEARKHYMRADEIDPKRYEVKNNLGMSYLQSGDFVAASEAFREAIYIQPQDPALYNNLGIAMASLGNYGAALKSFREYGSEADALNNLGYVCLMNGDNEHAIEYLEKALLAGPSDRTRVLVNLRTAEDALLSER